jgi:uncharacterized protein YbbC (DUF1343 family)
LTQLRGGLNRKFSVLLGVAFLLGVCIPAHASQKKSSRPGRVQTGLDVLEAEKFAPLRGKHIGLITNHTGLDAQGRSSIEVFFHAPGLQLVALFSPEHGISGRADDKYSSSKDPTTGLPTYSLYGESLRPTDEMLTGIDTLVFDVQDAGVRFYTYTATMAYCMEEGPMLDPGKTSIVGYYPLPIRYGLTIGELAQFFNVENHINCDLHVIAMKNWHRNYFFESTGIRWVPPSPNLRTVKGSIVYPGIEILQNAGVSVGRGTETPFEEFGAPWMDGMTVADRLNAIHLPGLRFADQPFIPVSGLYAGQRCGGVGIRITDRAAVRSVRVGLEIAVILQKLYPKNFDPAKLIFLVGNSETIRQLQAGVAPEQIVASWSTDLANFDQTRRKYFLYK